MKFLKIAFGYFLGALVVLMAASSSILLWLVTVLVRPFRWIGLIAEWALKQVGTGQGLVHVYVFKPILIFVEKLLESK